MAITITIDESPEGELELDLLVRHHPDPAMVQIASALLTELANHIQAHKECPDCNPDPSSHSHGRTQH